MEALKTNVLIWRMFMSSSMKAAIHLGPNCLANLEVYKNTNFEDIQSLFNITQKLTLEHSEEILNVNTIHSTSPSWTRSVLSHDQVTQRTKAEVRVCSGFRTLPGEDAWQQRCNYKMGRSSERIQDVRFIQRIAGNRWRSNWIRVEHFTRIFCHCRFFKRSRIICENGTSNHLYVNVQRHRLDKERKRWNLYFECRESQGIREEILARTLDVSGTRRRKQVVWNSSLHTWWETAFHSHSNGGTNQRYRSFSVQEHWCFESWNSEKEKWQRHHTLQCGFLEHTNLVPNHSFCKSAQYLRSSFELVWTIRPERKTES